MDKNLALDALGALANATRLDVFRLLVQAGPGGLPAGEIGLRLKVRQNTMSSHLGILARADLIVGVRSGREVHYRAHYDGMRRLLQFLLEDCCRGESEICSPLIEALQCAC